MTQVYIPLTNQKGEEIGQAIIDNNEVSQIKMGVEEFFIREIIKMIEIGMVKSLVLGVDAVAATPLQEPKEKAVVTKMYSAHVSVSISNRDQALLALETLTRSVTDLPWSGDLFISTSFNPIEEDSSEFTEEEKIRRMRDFLNVTGMQNSEIDCCIYAMQTLGFLT